MRKFSAIFMLISSMFPAMSYAFEACGVEVTVNRNHVVQTVTCAECRTFTDFGIFGGALLGGSSIRSIPVENENGVLAIVSAQRYIAHPTGANISADFLRRFGIQIDLPDPDRSAITVDTIKGYIFGSRWDSRRTLDEGLKAKCDQIEKEKEKEEEEDEDDTSYDLSNFTVVISGNYGQLSWNFGSGTSSYLRGGRMLSSLFDWRDVEITTTEYPPGTPVEVIRPCSASYCQMY